jgi:hypothetical protein
MAKLPVGHHLHQRLALDPEDRMEFYELRHFGASYMLNVLGLEAWVVAKQLRHRDGGILVTQLYGHPDRDEAISRMRRKRHQASGDRSGEAVRRSGKSRGNGITDLAAQRARRANRTLPLRGTGVADSDGQSQPPRAGTSRTGPVARTLGERGERWRV